MLKKSYIISLIPIIFFCLPQNAFLAQTYNPLINTWINKAEQTVAKLKNAEPVEEETGEDESKIKQCSKGAWTSFSKSFISYDNFIGDWGDLFRNDCLREDIWALESQLHKMNQTAAEQAIKCNMEIDSTKTAYKTLNQHINGLRKYGEHPEVEANDSENCPNCNKAKIVGEENINTKYSSTLYTDDGCELTRQESESWKEEWEKLEASINLYKNIKNMWADSKSQTGHSWGFNASDYAEAQKKANGWWGRTWESIYGYNGRQLTFRHLREGEDSLFNTSRLRTLGKNAGKAISKLLPPPTVADLTKKHKKQLDVYYELSRGEEKVIEDQELAKWKSQLDSRYTIHNEARLDLENYLIQMNNSIRSLIDDGNPIILNYYEKLKYTTENHCRNLYGACAE